MWIFQKFLRTPFLTKHLRWPLLETLYNTSGRTGLIKHYYSLYFFWSSLNIIVNINSVSALNNNVNTRSSCPDVFCKRGVLRNFAKFKTLVGELDKLNITIVYILWTSLNIIVNINFVSALNYDARRFKQHSWFK